MAIFPTNKKSYLGIDIGTSGIKAVEMADESGRPRLVSYGAIEVRADVVRSDTPEVQKRIVDALNQLRAKAHLESKRAVTALPSFAVFSSIISLPQMSKKELLAAVKWEAKKFVPMPLDEMILDWRLLKEGVVEPSKADKQVEAKGAKHLKVLLTAAPKNVVRRYVDIARAANLELVGLETEAFALSRSLVGNDRAPVLIVDIGAVATDLAIIAGGIPVLNRSIDVGGDTITRAVANAMNIDLERAEQFKRDVGMAAASSGGAVGVPKTIEFVVASIVNEIRYVFNLYRAQSEQPIEKIVLSGGSAFLPDLTGYLERTVGMKVVIGDPFARTIYPIELKPALDEIGPAFAAAVGLAMRPIV